ncbi:MAG: hypothetical protein SO471_00240 [Anaerobutyricum hallii]|uniref:hypothetical protein n=1 Tax=Anaerobutyricum hallii TaxID=39488 RepID=UPI002A7FB717|nr:hypothetical protein [Anaerobutyricum hallii]MDY4576443.1 hypothetical protein [Anaerobutyricum hallii]
MKRISYEKPQMYAETFIANQYIAACKEPIYNVQPMQVKCTSEGHDNTQYNTMFLDSQTACVVKFNPGVGTAKDDKFYTQFEACWGTDGCNRQNWLIKHPKDKDFKLHVLSHGTWQGDADGFILHDTFIDLSTAEKYQLS